MQFTCHSQWVHGRAYTNTHTVISEPYTAVGEGCCCYGGQQQHPQVFMATVTGVVQHLPVIVQSYADPKRFHTGSGIHRMHLSQQV